MTHKPSPFEDPYYNPYEGEGVYSSGVYIRANTAHIGSL